MGWLDLTDDLSFGFESLKAARERARKKQRAEAARRQPEMQAIAQRAGQSRAMSEMGAQLAQAGKAAREGREMREMQQRIHEQRIAASKAHRQAMLQRRNEIRDANRLRRQQADQQREMEKARRKAIKDMKKREPGYSVTQGAPGQPAAGGRGMDRYALSNEQDEHWAVKPPEALQRMRALSEAPRRQPGMLDIAQRDYDRRNRELYGKVEAGARSPFTPGIGVREREMEERVGAQARSPFLPPVRGRLEGSGERVTERDEYGRESYRRATGMEKDILGARERFLPKESKTLKNLGRLSRNVLEPYGKYSGVVSESVLDAIQNVGFDPAKRIVGGVGEVLRTPVDIGAELAQGDLRGAGRQVGQGFEGLRQSLERPVDFSRIARESVQPGSGIRTALTDPGRYAGEQLEEHYRRPMLEQAAVEFLTPETVIGSGALGGLAKAGGVGRFIAGLDKTLDIAQGGPLISKVAGKVIGKPGRLALKYGAPALAPIKGELAGAGVGAAAGYGIEGDLEGALGGAAVGGLGTAALRGRLGSRVPGMAGIEGPGHEAWRNIQRRGTSEEFIEKAPRIKGRMVGTPPQINEAADLDALRTNLENLRETGAQGRFWYKRSASDILRYAKGDVVEAKRFAGTLALLSPQQGVKGNATLALRALEQHAAGQPIRVSTRQRDAAVQAFLDSGQGWEQAKKTHSFLQNMLKYIDPSEQISGEGYVTADRHMATAFGFPTDKEGAARLTTQQYEFIATEVRRIADSIGWEPEEVQAAIWTAENARKMSLTANARLAKGGKPPRHTLQSMLAGGAQDFMDGIEEAFTQVSWETQPGASTNLLPGLRNLPLQDQVKFHADMASAFLDDDGKDMLADAVGIDLIDSFNGPGFWKGDVTPGAQTRLFAKAGEQRARAIEAYAAARAFLLKQDAIGYTRPEVTTNMNEANGVAITLGRTLNDQEMRDVAAAFKSHGFDEPGLIAAHDGLWAVNFDGMVTNPEWHGIVNEVVDSVWENTSETPSLWAFKGIGDLLENNWKEFPNGEGYLARLSAAGSPDIQQRLAAVFPEIERRVDAVYRDWESRLAAGGGVPGGGVSAGAAAEPSKWGGGSVEDALQSAGLNLSGPSAGGVTPPPPRIPPPAAAGDMPEGWEDLRRKAVRALGREVSNRMEAGEDFSTLGKWEKEQYARINSGPAGAQDFLNDVGATAEEMLAGPQASRQIRSTDKPQNIESGPYAGRTVQPFDPKSEIPRGGVSLPTGRTGANLLEEDEAYDLLFDLVAKTPEVTEERLMPLMDELQVELKQSLSPDRLITRQEVLDLAEMAKYGAGLPGGLRDVGRTLRNPLAQAGVGAGVGATLDEENRLRGAALGAGAGLAAGRLTREAAPVVGRLGRKYGPPVKAGMRAGLTLPMGGGLGDAGTSFPNPERFPTAKGKYDRIGELHAAGKERWLTPEEAAELNDLYATGQRRYGKETEAVELEGIGKIQEQPEGSQAKLQARTLAASHGALGKMHPDNLVGRTVTSGEAYDALLQGLKREGIEDPLLHELLEDGNGMLRSASINREMKAGRTFDIIAGEDVKNIFDSLLEYRSGLPGGLGTLGKAARAPIVQAGVGAGVGSYLSEEDRKKGALMGAGAGFGIGLLGRRPKTIGRAIAGASKAYQPPPGVVAGGGGFPGAGSSVTPTQPPAPPVNPKARDVGDRGDEGIQEILGRKEATTRESGPFSRVLQKKEVTPGSGRTKTIGQQAWIKSVKPLQEIVAVVNPAIKQAREVLVGVQAKVSTAAQLKTAYWQTRQDILTRVNEVMKAGSDGNLNYVGPADNPYKNTILDAAQNRHFYKLTNVQKEALDEMDDRNFAMLKDIRERFNVAIEPYIPKGKHKGSVYLPTVNKKKDLDSQILSEAESLSSNFAIIKERIHESAYDHWLSRVNTNEAFEAETDIAKLLDYHDTMFADMAAKETFKGNVGGLSKVGVLEMVDPELANRRESVKRSAASLRGKIETLEDKISTRSAREAELTSQSKVIAKRYAGIQHSVQNLANNYGPELSHLSGEAYELRARLDHVRSRMNKLGVKTTAEKQQLAGMYKTLKDLDDANRQITTEYDASVAHSGWTRSKATGQYHLAKTAKDIDGVMRTGVFGSESLNTITKVADEIRLVAFSADFSPLSIQGAIASFIDPVTTFRSARSTVTQLVKGGEVLRLTRTEPELVKRYAEATGRAFGDIGAEVSQPGRGIERIKPARSFNRKMLETVEVRLYHQWKNDTNLLRQFDPTMTQDMADYEAARALSQIVPRLNPAERGRSVSGASAERLLLTSPSFTLGPSMMIKDYASGIVKLSLGQTPAGREQLALIRGTSLMGTLATIAATSAYLQAEANQKDPWEAVKEVLDPTSTRFMHVIIGSKGSVPLGGPVLSIMKPMAKLVMGKGDPLEVFGRFASSKMAPVLGTIVDEVRNKDYFGNEIRKGTAPEQVGRGLWYIAENFVPLTAGAVIEGTRTGKNIQETFMSGLGQAIGTAPLPRYPNEVVERLIREHYDKPNWGEMTRAEKEDFRLRFPKENAEWVGEGTPERQNYEEDIGGLQAESIALDEALAARDRTAINKRDYWMAQDEIGARAMQAGESNYRDENGEIEGDDPFSEYLRMIEKNTTMVGNREVTNWDAIDQERALMEEEQPGWNDEVYRNTAASYGSPYVRAYNVHLRPLLNEYYKLPIYEGATAKEGYLIDEVWQRLKDTIAGGVEAPEAYKTLKELYPEATPVVWAGIEARAMGKSLIRSKAREQYKAQHPEINIKLGQGFLNDEELAQLEEWAAEFR